MPNLLKRVLCDTAYSVNVKELALNIARLVVHSITPSFGVLLLGLRMPAVPGYLSYQYRLILDHSARCQVQYLLLLLLFGSANLTHVLKAGGISTTKYFRELVFHR